MKSQTPHRNLEAWKVAMDLVMYIYRVTSDFPNEKKFGLVNQLRRAAVSVPSNIAEGSADRTPMQFLNILSIAIGSLAELNTQAEISFNFSYLEESNYVLFEKEII